MKKENFQNMVQKSTKKYGASARFPVWNGIVYALTPNQSPSIVPVKESSRYKKYKELLDFALYCLTNQPSGSWLYCFKSEKWVCVPLSFAERTEIAFFDKSATDNVPLNIPLTPIYPINDKELIYKL